MIPKCRGNHRQDSSLWILQGDLCLSSVFAKVWDEFVFLIEIPKFLEEMHCVSSKKPIVSFYHGLWDYGTLGP